MYYYKREILLTEATVMLKKIISALMAVLMIFSAFSFAVSAKGKTIANVQDAAKMCFQGELITIKKSTLYNGSKKVGTVYAAFLAGSNMQWDDSVNGLKTCVKSGMAKDNMYLDLLRETAKKDIPKGSKVILVGHSLGGMVAQQFAADTEMKERYEILNTLTMGSPYIMTEEREGGLYRMVDSGDIIPYLSTAFFKNFSEGNYTRIDNGYFGRPDAAHNKSYQLADSWCEYDCFGIKGGTNKITF